MRHASVNAPACNLCHGSRHETLERAGGIEVARCRTCGLVFLTPQPSRTQLEQAYDAVYYDAWASQAPARAGIWRARAGRVRQCAPPPARLLDVGCGAGDFLALAKELGWDTLGTELSAAGRARAGGRGLDVFRGELWEADLPAESVDVVTCWHVIEHVADPSRLLREVHRVLRAGGWLLLATPNLEDRLFRAAYTVARRRRPRLYVPGEREVHLYCFSAGTLRRLAATVGFDRIEIGFDAGSAVERMKRLVDDLARGWYRLTGLHWGMGLELTARKPGARNSG